MFQRVTLCVVVSQVWFDQTRWLCVAYLVAVHSAS